MKNKIILIDTCFWVALFNKNDSQHNKSLKLFRDVNNDTDQIAISEYIILEALTGISMKVSRSIASDISKKLHQDHLFVIIHITKNLYTDTCQIFRTIKRKNISFVDCSSVAIMKQWDIDKLLTFDTTDFEFLSDKYKFSLYPT